MFRLIQVGAISALLFAIVAMMLVVVSFEQPHGQNNVNTHTGKLLQDAPPRPLIPEENDKVLTLEVKQWSKDRYDFNRTLLVVTNTSDKSYWMANWSCVIYVGDEPVDEISVGLQSIPANGKAFQKHINEQGTFTSSNCRLTHSLTNEALNNTISSAQETAERLRAKTRCLKAAVDTQQRSQCLEQ